MIALTKLDRAPGGPGIEPRWTRGAKAAVGTAYSTSPHVWYTLDHGCVTEVYYPTIDSPQIRDLQFLFTDGRTNTATRAHRGELTADRQRFTSRGEADYQDKSVSAMRYGFGGDLEKAAA